MTDQNTVYRGDYDTQPEEDDPLAELARIVSGDVPANSSNPNVGQPAAKPQKAPSEPQISTSDFASALAEELDPPPAAGSAEPAMPREAEPSLEDQLLNEMGQGEIGQGASPDPIAGTAPNPAPSLAPGAADAQKHGAPAEPVAMMSRATPTVPQETQPEAATPPSAEPASDADSALARLEAVAKSLTGEPAGSASETDTDSAADIAAEQPAPGQAEGRDELSSITLGNALIDQQTGQPDGMEDAEADLEAGFAEMFAAELDPEDTHQGASGDGAATDQGESADPMENHFADAFAQELAIDAAGGAPSIVPGIDDGGGHHDATLNEDGFDTRADAAPATGAQEAVSQPTGPNRGFRLAVGALIVALLVGTGVVAWGTFTDSGSGADGKPPVIRADSEPAKVKPEDPGGKVIANQENQVYERVAGGEGTENNTQEELITSREQPVDVAGKTASRLSPDSAGSASATPLGLPPKKVRTLVVKPDGTIVSNGEPATAAATAGSAPASPSAQTLALAQPGAAQEGAESATQETADPAVITLDGAQSTGGFAIPTPSPLPAPTQQAAAPAPKPAAQTPQPAAQSNSQSNSQGDTGAPTQIASAPASPQPAAARPAVTSSEWKIQVSSQRSRGAAESSFDNIKRRFSSILGDRTASIERADIEGKGTFYRVKVLASSRKDATDICGRLKSAGGSCFVTR